MPEIDSRARFTLQFVHHGAASSANGVSFLMYAGLFGTLFLMPQFLQSAQHYTRCSHDPRTCRPHRCAGPSRASARTWPSTWTPELVIWGP